MESTNEVKKMSFFRRLKIALIDLEDYVYFLPETSKKVIGYMFKAAIIFSIIMGLTSVINIYARFGSVEKCMEETIPEFTYENNNLKIETDVNTSSDDAVLLNNLIQIATSDKDSYSKADLMEEIRQIPQFAYLFGIIFYIFYNIFNVIIYWAVIAFLIIIIEYLLLLFSRIKMRFDKMYTLAIYASTFSVILTVIYSILNQCFGIYIDIFDYMTIIISYIYISAVILIIKSGIVRQQVELIRITNMQTEIKNEEEQKEDEKKEEKKEKNKEEDGKQEKPKEEKKETEEGSVNNEPDGSEI